MLGPGLFIGGFLILFVAAIVIIVIRERRRGAKFGEPGSSDPPIWVHNDDNRSYYDGGD